MMTIDLEAGWNAAQAEMVAECEGNLAHRTIARIRSRGLDVDLFDVWCSEWRFENSANKAERSRFWHLPVYDGDDHLGDVVFKEWHDVRKERRGAGGATFGYTTKALMRRLGVQP